MTTTPDRVLALMALMRDIEKPSACYNRAVRRAAQTLTDSPENDAAQARGNAALLEIEQAVRAWTAKHPDPEQARRVLGETTTDAGAQPAGTDLRDRIASAISKWHRDPEQPLYTQGADAVLAALDRLRRLADEAQQPEGAVTEEPAPSCRCHSREGLTPEQHENDCPDGTPDHATEEPK